MNRNNIYTVNPLYNGSTTQTTEDGSVQSGGTTIIYQQGGGTGLTDAQKQKLDGIQEGAEVNQNAYSKVRLNGSDALIIEAKNKTDILNMSGVYPIAIAINGNGGLDFTVSSDQSNTNSVVTQSQLKAAIDQLEKDKYWKVDADGKLYTELDVYSHKEISAYGAGTGGGSTGGAGALYECADVLRDGDKVKGAEVGSVLSYNGTHWYAIPQSAIVPDLSGYATKSYVSQEINDLIGGAPGTLDTLKEIAEALGNNPNFATTVTEMINNIGLRVDQVEDRVVSLEDMFEWDKSASASDPSLWRIKAKKDLYGVGEISAYGLGETQPSVTTLAGLDDVTITSPANGQTLIYDSATSQWKNGTIIGGGNISLNGTVYKPVNGTITLPVASNSLAFNEGIVYAKSDGITEIGNKLDFHDPATTNQDYDYRLHQIYDNGAVLVGSGKFRATGFQIQNGTSSQFLKADGSVDSNLYALAYGGDQNSIQYSSKSNYLRVIDRRNDTILPTSYDNYSISGLFHISGMPSSNWWSGIHVKGWGEGYATWELVGPSSTDNTNNRLYYRDGKGSSWATDWKGIAFLEDCNKVATPYFEGQNIYSDYVWWVVALCKLSPADSEYNYASGTMFYRRGNGIYPNGSVQFNVIKRYNQTNVNFGVLYNGYGINEGEDAPKPCTFTYNGVKYAGLKWASAASLDSIKTLIYDISTTGLPFYVKYFNSQSGEVFNTEIKNSIVELGSDISGTGLGTIGTIRILNRKAIDIKGEDWGYIQQASADRMFHVAVAKSTQSGLGGGLGNYEIRCNGTSEEGIFVRYSGSSYGKLGVVNRNGQESSISYYNNNTAVGADKPLWTVGAGIRNAYSFDWWFGTNGYRMTIDSDGKLFINRINNNEGGPSVSLAIGDSDTGLQWQADGIIEFRSNSKQVGYWGYTNGRLFNCYFREPSGVTYEKASLMINGNGSTISPSIGFHQPGVVGCHLELDNGGNFRFKDSSGYRNVYAGNLIADAGFLYSRYNGIEIKIGAQNSSFVHITNNANKPYYIDNTINISGTISPYSGNIYDLGRSASKWNYIWGNHFMGNSASATYILPNYVGGQQSNPQTYFNNTVGVKVAMTGSIKYWNDTLWINGYSGGDVKDMCALHTVRDGTPQMYISTQKSDATSYGTMYLFYTSYNANKSDRPWTCSTLNARDQVLAGSYIQALGGVNCAGVLNTGGASSFNVYATFHGNASHGGIEIGASDNVLGIGVHSDDSWYIWWTNSGSIGSSSNKSYIFSYNGSSWNFTGSVVASGEVTAYSDARLKSNIHTLDYRGRLIPRHYVKDGKQSIGFIAQEVQTLYPELVLGYDKSRPYLSLNYNGCTAVLSAQLNHVEDEVTLLKKRVEFLEKEVKRLSE